MTITSTSTTRIGRRMGAAVVAAAALWGATACLPINPVPPSGVFSACAAADGTIRLLDKDAGASCPEGETLVQWNQQGPQGTAGPQGAAGPAGPAGPGQVLDAVTVSGHGVNPASAQVPNRLGVHAAVDVPEGGRVHVVATKVIGTTGTYGFASLDAWICHRLAGTTSAFTTVGEASAMVLQGGDRVPVTISTVIEGLPAGQYEVGLCAQTAVWSRWNDNSTSHVTAMVLAGA